MRRIIAVSFLILALGLGFFLPAGAETPVSGSEGGKKVVFPRPVKIVDAQRPPGLTADQEGLVVIQFLVTKEGTTTAIQVKRASSPVFAEAAQKAVSEWRFKPGLRDGKPSAFRFEIPIHFLPDFTNALETRVGRPLFVDLSKRDFVKESDLRTPLRLRSWLEPVYPESLRGSGVVGRVFVSFAVGPDGRVVNPTLIKANNSRFIEPALECVARWRYFPPVVASAKPIYVWATEEITFREKPLWDFRN